MKWAIKHHFPPVLAPLQLSERDGKSRLKASKMVRV